MSGSIAETIALSLGTGTLLTGVFRRWRLPALIPLIIAGIALGKSGLGVIDAEPLGATLKGVITVAVGLLIFEGALHLNKQELSHAPRAVLGLISIGAVITAAGAACAAHYALGLSWPIAAVLGAMLSVTGPTVVQPLLRLMPVPSRLQTALAGEAVLIDPVGVVGTVVTLEIVGLLLSSKMGVDAISQSAWLFARAIFGGAGVGLVMGLVGLGVLRLCARAGRPDVTVMNLLVLGVLMLCVGLGEAVGHEGGLTAAALCGMVMARARVLGGTELRSVQELFASVLVGTLFVLLSSRFDVTKLLSLGAGEIAFLGLLMFAVRPVSVFLSTIGSRLSLGERLFAGTFAPRGIVALSVSAVAASTLSQIAAEVSVGDPGAAAGLTAEIERLEPITFLVILGSVLLGTTYSPLFRWVLRLKVGSDAAVVIVGAHRFSIDLAKLLREHAVPVRLIDTNEDHVQAASALGLDATAGDATNSRWMDDLGAPHGAGWLIAWTGNHVVDQIAVRWATEKFGPGRALASSDDWMEPTALAGQGMPLASDTRAVRVPSAGVMRVVSTTKPETLARLLAWKANKTFSLEVPGATTPTTGTLVYFGLAITDIDDVDVRAHAGAQPGAAPHG